MLNLLRLMLGLVPPRSRVDPADLRYREAMRKIGAEYTVRRRTEVFEVYAWQWFEEMQAGKLSVFPWMYVQCEPDPFKSMPPWMEREASWYERLMGRTPGVGTTPSFANGLLAAA